MTDQILTCVYCGHQYPPGTPPSQHEALNEHIKECPKHPLKFVRNTLRKYIKHVGQCEGVDFIPATVADGEIFTKEELALLHELRDQTT